MWAINTVWLASSTKDAMMVFAFVMGNAQAWMGIIALCCLDEGKAPGVAAIDNGIDIVGGDVRSVRRWRALAVSTTV
jgi:3-oxoacyl-(acyl-carrier-protein) synthase